MERNEYICKINKLKLYLLIDQLIVIHLLRSVSTDGACVGVVQIIVQGANKQKKWEKIINVSRSVPAYQKTKSIFI